MHEYCFITCRWILKSSGFAMETIATIFFFFFLNLGPVFERLCCSSIKDNAQHEQDETQVLLCSFFFPMA